MRLFWILIGTGVAFILFHEFLYRRFTEGPGDYELGGIMTHAAVDMSLLTLTMAVVGLAWTTSAKRPR